MDLPDLLEIQTKSYSGFLQAEVPPRLRKKEGLSGVFQSLFPVNDVKGYYSLEFDGYKLGVPKYTIKECKERGMTFAAPLKVDMSLLVYEQDGEVKKFVEKISNEVYVGEIPLMTERGTFVINGAERVIVSQLHRSPGITFDEEEQPNGEKELTARIIPQRGSWVEMILDVDDVLTINIDRRKKMPATILMRALGYSTDEKLLALFHQRMAVTVSAKNKPEIVGKVNAVTLFNKETGEIIIDANEIVTDEKFAGLVANKIDEVQILADVANPENMIIRNTIAVDPTKSEEEALFYIYATMRPGDPPNVETARNLVQRLFFDEKRYDLGNVGRYRLNTRLGLKSPEGHNTLSKDDFVAAFKYLISLGNGEGFIDDIDHLGNRRVRSVGELLSTQFTVGLTRMVRTIRERLSLRDNENITPQDLINARTVSTVVQAFFGSSQLSQFLDQTNPLSELTHKRRVSALGPGGLTRERAGFEVRDVHHTHYGRLCPIETPEGPNIGLIASLSTFARVNGFGFIETPYQKIEDGRLTGDIDYLTADQEDNYKIAQANTPIGEKGKITESLVFARYRGDFVLLTPGEVTYMDISPMQLVSVAAGLIPFLEHDDANRALMGSNMQRQAVPLFSTEAPLIGTGLEYRAAKDSGCMIIARNPGVIDKVDATKIVVRKTRTTAGDDILGLTEFDTYDLIKYERSNQDTCINQKVCVSAGDKVKAGDVLADGHATKDGELALGRNVMVAFMPWRGYNFEDAIIISEKLVADDIYTSLHIEVFETEVRDTKRGPEELTREIPNVSEDAVRNLDENGVVRVGTEVDAGDILVGKVTPKGETELSPEERLLRAIFGEKAGDVRDSSLKAPPGLKGIVMDTRIYSRKERDKRSKKKDKRIIDEMKLSISKQISDIEKARLEKLTAILADTLTRPIANAHTGETVVPEGRKWTKLLLNKMDFSSIAFTERAVQRLGQEQKGRRGVLPGQGPCRQARRQARQGNRQDRPRRRAQARRSPACKGIYRQETEAFGRRQDGRPARKQGGHLQNRSCRRPAVFARRHSGRHHSQSSRRPVAHELRPDPRDPHGMGCGEARPAHCDARVRRRQCRRRERTARQGKTAPDRQDSAAGRPDGRAVRPGNYGRAHLHDETLPSRGRQDPRAVHRPVFAGDAAATRREIAVRRTALRRNGSVGAGGIRRRLHAAADPYREKRRPYRAVQDIRSDCQRRKQPAVRSARVI